MRLSVTSTTGSGVELTVPRGETVEGLRTRLSQKLRIPRDRIVLLHEDRQLGAGRLLDLGVADESKLTLVPAIESGLSQGSRSDRTLMDVLESLTDAQINDFLSGRSALTIKLGMGANMLYVQLQLGAQNVVETQQHQDSTDRSSNEPQTGLGQPGDMIHPDPSSSSSPTTLPSTSVPAQISSPLPDSTSPIQLSTQRPRASFHLAPPTSHVSRSPMICHDNSSPHHSCPAHSAHTPAAFQSTSSLPPGFPRPSFPQPAAPVCSPSHSSSSPGPASPAQASTFKEMASSAELCKQPGAVIESFVNHSPGLFSGTFSGTLAPCSQSSVGHPRRGITIILQILTDLLRATFPHQRAPPTLSQLHCPAADPPVSPLFKTGAPSEAGANQLVTESAGPLHFHKTEGQLEVESSPLHSSPEENQTLHSKLERLHFLMDQRRLRRRTRSGTQLSQASQPYQQHHRHPWSPAHCHRKGSGSSLPDDQRLQVNEELPWKPELKSDFVVV